MPVPIIRFINYK